MSEFLQDEKPEQADFKAKAPYFSEAARVEGLYRNHPYPYCLPREYAVENLVPEIRQTIIAYFKRNEIKWTMGKTTNRVIICATLKYVALTFCSPSMIIRRH